MTRIYKDLLKSTIFDPELQPYLLESDKKLKKELEFQFYSELNNVNENFVVFFSLAPLSLLYFHVRLALLIKHLQNIGGRIFLLNLDNVVLAHRPRNYFKFYPLEGKKRFISLLKALGVNTESEYKFRFADASVLYDKISDKDEYLRYHHAIDVIELAELLSSLKECRPFCRLIDIKAYADDVYLSATVVREELGSCDFISGGIDRIPVYNYCSKVFLNEFHKVPPAILPFASMPLIQSDISISGSYPAIEDAQSEGLVKLKLKESRLSKQGLILLLKTLLLFYEDITNQQLDSLNSIRNKVLNDMSQLSLMDVVANGIEELFSILNEKMRNSLFQEVKEFSTEEEIREVLIGIGMPLHKYKILREIFEKPGITASELHKCVPELDKATVYRTLEQFERIGLVFCNRLTRPAKYKAAAKRMIIRFESR